MKTKFIFACLFLFSMTSFGQKLKPFPKDKIINFFDVDKYTGRGYLSVKVTAADDSMVQVWMLNSDLYRLLSDQFNSYDTYSDTIANRILGGKILEVSAASMAVLKKYAVTIPSLENVDPSAVVNVYFDKDGFLKARYNQDDKDVQGVLAYLFISGFLFYEDDVSGIIFIKGLDK